MEPEGSRLSLYITIDSKQSAMFPSGLSASFFSCPVFSYLNKKTSIYLCNHTDTRISTQSLLMLPLHSTWFHLSSLVRNDTPQGGSQQRWSFAPRAGPAALLHPVMSGQAVA